jgi:hypothetical protein
MTEQTHIIGIPLTAGYLTVKIEADSEEMAMELVSEMARSHQALNGKFGMAGAPSHGTVNMILEPAHIIGYVYRGTE